MNLIPKGNFKQVAINSLGVKIVTRAWYKYLEKNKTKPVNNWSKVSLIKIFCFYPEKKSTTQKLVVDNPSVMNINKHKIKDNLKKVIIKLFLQIAKIQFYKYRPWRQQGYYRYKDNEIIIQPY